MKKLFLFLFIGTLLINFTSAAEWDNVVYDRGTGPMGYENIEIKNALGLGETLFEGSLTNHSFVCGQDCYSKLEINHSGGVLIDELNFYTIVGEDRIKQDVRNYNLRYEAELPEYETECEATGEFYGNGTEIVNCTTNQVGTYAGFLNYQVGTELDTGNYELYLEAKKKPSRTVDWVMTIQGRELVQWAVWGNISLGADAEVILNSPEDNNISYTYSVDFNCSAEISGGASLTNISLWTNGTGTWSLNDTLNVANQNVIAHYYLDEASGNAVDTTGTYDLTEYGTVDSQTGVINNSRGVYSGTERFASTSHRSLNGSEDFSHNVWLYRTGNQATEARFLDRGTTTTNDFFYGIRLETDNSIRLVMGKNGVSSSVDIDSSYVIPLSTWTMITVTHNSSGATTLYINGVNNGSDTFTETTNSSSWFTLGNGFSATNALTSSYLDEVLETDNVLSQNEIDLLYNSGSASRLLETSYTNVFTQTIDDTTLWSCQACDSDGDCGFATENRTVSLDGNGPSINIAYPTPQIGLYEIGGQLDLNVTITDVNLDSCWYEYNNINTTFSCTSGVLSSEQFTGVVNEKELRVYANDTLGNINNSLVSWTPHLTIINQTYSSEITETSLNEFEIYVNHSSSDWSSIAANLNYDGTNYTGVSSGSGDIISLSASFNVPSVNSSENKTFYWIVSLTNATQTYDYALAERNQTVSNVTFDICGAGETPLFNFTTWGNSATPSLLDATFETYWEIYDSSGPGTIVNSETYSDLTELNNTWQFCVSPNNTNYTINLQAIADATNYTETHYYISEATYSPGTNDIKMYLYPDSEATLTEIYVVDRARQGVEDVTVFIQEYDLSTDSYYTIDMAVTDFDGTDLVYLNWYDTWYRFALVYNGELVKTTGAKKISETPVTIELFDEVVSSVISQYDDMSYTFSLNDAETVYSLSYTLPSGVTADGCINVVKRNSTGQYEICNTCSSSSSATLYCNIASAGNGTFIAKFITDDGSLQTEIKRLVDTIGGIPPLYDLIGNDDGTGLAIIMAGVVVSFFLFSPVLAVVGAVLGVLSTFALGFQPYDQAAFLAIVAVGGAVVLLFKR